MMSDLTPLKKLLQKTIHTYKLDRQVNAAQACHYFRKWADETWANEFAKTGREGSSAIEPTSYKDGVLRVRVKNSIWAHQMYLKQTSFVEYFKKVCPEVRLKGVKTRTEEAKEENEGLSV